MNINEFVKNHRSEIINIYLKHVTRVNFFLVVVELSNMKILIISNTNNSMKKNTNKKIKFCHQFYSSNP